MHGSSLDPVSLYDGHFRSSFVGAYSFKLEHDRGHLPSAPCPPWSIPPGQKIEKIEAKLAPNFRLALASHRVRTRVLRVLTDPGRMH